jgi:hypothetical protein
MPTIDELIQRVRKAGHSVEFYGPQGDEKINDLAAALGTDLSPSFREFLRRYGGGGVVGEWISGIYGGQPLLTNQGSVFGDAVRWRERHHLPPDFVPVYTQEDEVCWCLDTARNGRDGESPIVSFDKSNPHHATKIADSFEEFFREYLEIHSQGAAE